MPRKKHIVTREFRKGQKLHLDDIYDIQGIGCGPEFGGQWWSHDNEATSGDDITVTRDITIRIEIS